MAPRAPSAYFIFANEVRATIHAEIAAENDGKAGVAVVGKEIGRRWNALTDEEKQTYKDLATQRAQELKDQLEAQRQEAQGEEGAEGEGDDQQPGPGPKSGPPPLPFGLPTSLVKKIACMDPEVSRMTADGVRALSKATALFIGLLAEAAFDNARLLKRKNFKFSDIEEAARTDKRMVDMGLLELLQNDRVFAEVHEKIEEESRARKENKKAAAAEKEKEEGKKTKPITAFFKGAGAVEPN